MNVQKSSVAELEAADNFHELLAEYAAESAIDGLPPAVARMEIYRHLESVGMLHVISATSDGHLIGFINVLVAPHPRYSVPVAVSEGFFVAKAHRKTGAGLMLLRAAEDKARELGSAVLLVSAPFEGDLFHVLPRRGYIETNRTFCKKVANV